MQPYAGVLTLYGLLRGSDGFELRKKINKREGFTAKKKRNIFPRHEGNKIAENEKGLIVL